MADLFDSDPKPKTDQGPRPLADRLRPQKLADVIGQDQVLGPEAPLGVMLASGSMGSLVFWGPPGVGKTTIARLLADATSSDSVSPPSGSLAPPSISTPSDTRPSGSAPSGLTPTDPEDLNS